MNRHVGSVLLIQLGDIGDVVLTLPAVAVVRRCFPVAKMIVAVREKARDLLEGHPWIDAVVGVETGKRNLHEALLHQWRFFSRLRSYRFDLAFDFRTGTRGALMALLSGARERVGFHERGSPPWRRLCFHRLYRREYQLGEPVAVFYASLLACHGLTIADEDLKVWLPVSPEREEKVDILLRNLGAAPKEPLAALQPCSLWRYKEWDIRRYTALMERLRARQPWTFVLTGSPEERERIAALQRQCLLPENVVINLAGKTDIGDLPALFRRCALFIGPDSAGLHIAAAVGTPTVGIFGPSSPASWAPRGERHAVAAKDFPCVPCRRKGCDDEGGVSKCLEELTVDEVWSVVERQLS
ncbi:MAG TPA: glycosyltransferase family 9 protein [Syntrophales bacterium]|nr:glycosyltransferase family 9 protein [Syntrophales bacterium]HOM08433.1 glycosyltransferase family 9 protein [Syntrophales bacterium]HOO00660.1 glycosyltransferase family 9 protein [Syntrophales bacterium]HRS49073.1 glycosyltransferase family 9 protein [Thermovirgaceae bacterium]